MRASGEGRGVELARAGVVVGWILTSLYGVLVCGVCLLACQGAPIADLRGSGRLGIDARTPGEAMTDQPQGPQPSAHLPAASLQPVPRLPAAAAVQHVTRSWGLVLAVVVLPPLGIYFGNLAKKQIGESGERGIELANAAVIVGWES